MSYSDERPAQKITPVSPEGFAEVQPHNRNDIWQSAGRAERIAR